MMVNDFNAYGGRLKNVYEKENDTYKFVYKKTLYKY